jgi:hypothetical protein
MSTESISYNILTTRFAIPFKPMTLELFKPTSSTAALHSASIKEGVWLVINEHIHITTFNVTSPFLDTIHHSIYIYIDYASWNNFHVHKLRERRTSNNCLEAPDRTW